MRGWALLLVLLAVSGCSRAYAGLAQPPAYLNDSFVIAPGNRYYVTYANLRVGTVLEGNFLVTGGKDDVGFQIQGPNGGYVLNIGRVSGHYDYSYTVPVDGTYKLILDNSYSLFTSKHVALSRRAYLP